MKQILVLMFFGIFQAGAQTSLFELAPPVLKCPSGFFTDRTKVVILFNEPGTITRYTLDGSEPTSSSAAYTKPIELAESATIKARNFNSRFLPSQTASVTVTKMGKPLKRVGFTSPSPNYKGNGPATLHDGKGGVANHSHPNWLGYSTDSVVFDVEAAKPFAATAVVLDIMNNDGAWIFPPDSVQVFAVNKGQSTMVATWKADGQKLGQGVQTIRIPLPGNINLFEWRILVFPVRSIEGDHPGKGQRGWFFTDEILVF
jgi:Chitobiase/beta-hexosaminidase C-terminal domain